MRSDTADQHRCDPLMPPHQAIRSLSRSRSREPRSSSGQRRESGFEADKLGAVNESSSTVNGGASHDQHEKHGLIGKIASHLPHSHKESH